MSSTLSIRDHETEAFDPLLLWSSLFLIMMGLLVYSASIGVASERSLTGHNPEYFFYRHLVFLIIGLVAGGIIVRVPLARIQELAPMLFLCGCALLLLVLIPGIGHEVKGASRWISLKVINVQPSELMKVFTVLYAADYTVRKMKHRDDLKKSLGPMIIAMIVVGVLLLSEPDFGAFVVVASIAISILFLGGMRLRWFLFLILVLIIAFMALIYFEPYRMSRVLIFMDPWIDPLNKGYQLAQALIAFGNGEWFGVGLGGGIQKLMYLPEAHTDFMLAIIGEELGFFGVFFVIALFATFVFRSFKVGRKAASLNLPFAALVAQGVGIWFGLQGVISMGVNLGLLPTKGLTLPLMSYGGSALVSNLLILAILFRVDFENRIQERRVR